MDINAFFKLSYGIYLISTGNGTGKSGYIANTAFQVTSTPPRLAISCHKENNSAEVIEKTGVFNLSVLEKGTDAGLIGLFGYKSGNENEKFDRVAWKTGNNGAPIITTHAAAWFECRVVDKIDVGTHILFIGEVTDAVLSNPEGEPLTYDYFRNEMKLMAPERAPTYVDKGKTGSDAGEAGEPSGQPEKKAQKYICTICAWVYDPEKGDPGQGIAPGTPFEELPDDWVCPVCAAARSMFIIEN
ncbi:MAG: flavin reductase [Bacteroidales bacterium]